MSIDRVTFFNADKKTVFELHSVPFGADAKQYARDWVEREQRQGRPRGHTRLNAMADEGEVLGW